MRALPAEDVAFAARRASDFPAGNARATLLAIGAAAATFFVAAEIPGLPLGAAFDAAFEADFGAGFGAGFETVCREVLASFVTAFFAAIGAVFFETFLPAFFAAGDTLAPDWTVLRVDFAAAAGFGFLVAPLVRTDFGACVALFAGADTSVAAEVAGRALRTAAAVFTLDAAVAALLGWRRFGPGATAEAGLTPAGAAAGCAAPAAKSSSVVPRFLRACFSHPGRGPRPPQVAPLFG